MERFAFKLGSRENSLLRILINKKRTQVQNTQYVRRFQSYLTLNGSDKFYSSLFDLIKPFSCFCLQLITIAQNISDLQIIFIIVSLSLYSKPYFRVDLIQVGVIIVRIQRILVDEVGDRGAKDFSLDTQNLFQRVLVFVNRTQQNFAHNFSLLVFLYDFLYRHGILFPNFLNNEWRICQYKIKKVVILLGDFFWLVEVVLKIVGVVLAEFLIKLKIIDIFYVKYVEAFGVFDGVKYARSGHETTCLGFYGLTGEEQDGFLGVPILVQVSVLLVFHQEPHGFLLHFWFDYNLKFECLI